MNIKKLIATASLITVSGFASLTHAVTPAETTLTNTASLTFAGLLTPITASVDVVIDLTSSAPVLSVPGDATVTEGQAVTYSQTITSTANGSDVYTLSGGTTVSNVSGTSSVTFEVGGSPITTVTLGASAASIGASSGTAMITVPQDLTPAIGLGASVNNLQENDLVEINGSTYEIGTIEGFADYVEITLTTNLGSGVIVGDLIAERQSFDVVLTTIGVATGSPATVDITTSGQSSDTLQTGSQATATQITLTPVSFEKYVRNDTNPNGSSPAYNDGADDFYASSEVTASAGDTLEYAIVVTAPASGAMTNVVVSDTVPVFSSFGVDRVETGTTVIAGATSFTEAQLAAGIALRSLNGTAVGEIAAGESAIIYFTVILQN